jgi:hypothetical protein
MDRKMTGGKSSAELKRLENNDASLESIAKMFEKL